jgi:hypothetical protein
VNDADDKPAARGPRPMSSPRPPMAVESFGDMRGFGGGGGGTPDFAPPFRRNGGSRRGLRAKKRSLR